MYDHCYLQLKLITLTLFVSTGMFKINQLRLDHGWPSRYLFRVETMWLTAKHGILPTN